MPASVRLYDVGPRDGLQNEPDVLAPDVRAELVRRLVRAGLTAVEVASFVDPRRVPQMAGAEEVVASLEQVDDVVYAGLALNERGYERLAATGLGEVRFSFGATESFNQRNQNASVEESLDLARRVAERARADGIRSTLIVSVAFGCPFEGPVEESRVLELAESLAEARPDVLMLADTIGVAVPAQVRRLIEGVAALGLPIGGHFHNTRNTGYANALASLEAGASVLDASVGGLGGCPFAPRATGNIATEDLVYLLHGEGVETGVELDALVERLRVARGRARAPPRRPGLPGRPVSRPRRASRARPSPAPRRAPPRPHDPATRPRRRPRGTSARCRPRARAARFRSGSARAAIPPTLAPAPEIVPVANRSPVRIEAPFTVAWASCCGIVQ